VKILLDNCMDIRAKSLFAGHQVEHVLDVGWDSLNNGKLLLAAAEAKFDVMVTVDKNLRFQQNLEALPLSVIEFDVVKNRLAEIQGLGAFVPKSALSIR